MVYKNSGSSSAATDADFSSTVKHQQCLKNWDCYNFVSDYQYKYDATTVFHYLLNEI
jgi:hypothetical protein